VERRIQMKDGDDHGMRIWVMKRVESKEDDRDPWI
jgi:hypothetical protein